METTTENFNARREIENAIRQEARRLWDDIIHVAETKGVEQIAELLACEIPSIGRKRVTSRSTSVVSNLLDDLKDGIIINAYTVLGAPIYKEYNRVIDSLKHAAASHVASL